MRWTRTHLLWLVTGGLVLSAGPARAQEEDDHQHKPKADPPAAKLPGCVVMSEDPVNFAVRELTDEGPVYFCCERCPSKYKAAPEKYAKQATAQREALRKLPRIQTTCPISSKPIDKKVSIEQDGQKIYFCSNSSLETYRKDAARYRGKLEASYTYQTICPVGGRTIDPTAFSDLPDGNRVYFCCRGCDAKLRADPGKYAAKLEAQGTYLDVEKIKAGAKDDKKEKGDKPGQP